jgi:hypothetical protein
MLQPPRARVRFLFASALFLIVASHVGCAARWGSSAFPGDDSPTARLAVRQLRELAALTRRESLTWTVADRPLRDMPWMVADAEAPERLAQLALKAAEPDAFEPEARAILDALLSNGWNALRGSLEGMDDADELAAFARPAFDAMALREQKLLNALETPSERRDWALRLVGAQPGDYDGGWSTVRLASTLPLAPFLYGWMSYHIAVEDRGPGSRDFAKARLLQPDASRDASIAARLSRATEEELLAFYAPAIAQEIADSPEYDPANDRPGTAIIVDDGRGRPTTGVATDRATLYARSGSAYLGGAWLRQLSYTVWYPEHPAVHGAFDPEAGRTEGLSFRLTLDQENRPLVAETVAACGCYHRVFPSDELEEAARAEFDDVVSNHSPLGRANRFKIDAYVPEPLGAFDPARPHATIYVRAGTHLIASAKFESPATDAIVERAALDLRPWEDLRRLPWRNGRASFFAPDGLARGADRLEATLLYPTGIYHAGTPRLDETRLIHFDQYDYADPRLLEKLLRWPQGASAGALAKRKATRPDRLAARALGVEGGA